MIPADLIDRARLTPIESVVQARGIKLRGGVDRAGACANCGGHDRFSINVRKQVFHCRNCGIGGDVIALVQFLDGVDFRTAVTSLAGEIQVRARPSPTTPRPPVKAADDEQPKHDLAFAKRIGSEIVPLIGTPGEVYLHHARKIDVAALEDVLTRADAIGWHPAVYFNSPEHPLHGRRLGCIVGIMTDAKTALPTGAISRTYIGPDLTKISKSKTLGAPTGMVRLSTDDEVLEGLCLAEGIETALTGMSWGLRPTWSTGSTGLLAAFPVLSGIEALTVVVDHDVNGAGERAAREAEARWLAAGKEVKLFRPDAPGDFNDALKGSAL
jgi:hypothetical protein